MNAGMLPDTLIEQRIQDDPDFREGLDWQQTGHMEEAVAAYRRSLAKGESEVVQTFLAWALSEQGDLHGAIASCKKAIRLNPEFGHAWNDLAGYLMETGRVEEALFPIRRALKAKHFDNPHLAWMNLSRYYLHQGKMRKALEAADEANRISNGFRPARKLAEWIRDRMEEWGLRE